MSTLSLSPTTTRKVLAAIVAFLLVSLAIIRTSEAAFTAETTNPDNEFATAFIDLETEDERPLFGDTAGTPAALFDGLGLVPNQQIEGCLDVDYTGDDNLDALNIENVVFDVTGATDDLAGELTVTVDRLDSCTGGTSQGTIVNAVALDSISNVDTGWEPAGATDSRGFRFTIDVGVAGDPDNPGDGGVLPGMTAEGIDLTWSVATTAS